MNTADSYVVRPVLSLPMEVNSIQGRHICSWVVYLERALLMLNGRCIVLNADSHLTSPVSCALNWPRETVAQYPLLQLAMARSSKVGH